MFSLTSISAIYWGVYTFYELIFSTWKRWKYAHSTYIIMELSTKTLRTWIWIDEEMISETAYELFCNILYLSFFFIQSDTLLCRIRNVLKSIVDFNTLYSNFHVQFQIHTCILRVNLSRFQGERRTSCKISMLRFDENREKEYKSKITT